MVAHNSFLKNICGQLRTDVAGLNHVLIHLFQNRFLSVFFWFWSSFFGFWKLLELVWFRSCQKRQKNRTGPDFKALATTFATFIFQHLQPIESIVHMYGKSFYKNFPPIYIHCLRSRHAKFSSTFLTSTYFYQHFE